MIKELFLGLTAILSLSLLAACQPRTEPAYPEQDSSYQTKSAQVAKTATVYMTSAITPEGLAAVYKALNIHPQGKIAIKLHSGESDKSNYLRASLISHFIKSFHGTIVECNTAYGGNRADTASHEKMIARHGFKDMAPVDIMDAEGEVALPVKGGRHLKENYVGKNFLNYDYFVVLSHFKGHAMGGYGGAIKNTSIGIASSSGKCWIHTAGQNRNNFAASVKQDDFLESMAEAAKSVSDHLKGNIVYVNVMNRLSVDCDCDGRPQEPEMKDIGILASTDPVALDQACLDLVYAAPDNKALVERIESKHGVHQVEYGEEIGLGTRTYKLIDLDKKGSDAVVVSH